MRKTLFFFFLLLCVCCEETSSDAKDAVDEKIPLVNKEDNKDKAPAPPTFSNDFIMGKFNPETDDLFEEVPQQYSSRRGLYMHKEAMKAFLEMADAARADGINFKVVSAARNFFRQKQIWEAKWNGSRLVGGKNLSKTIKDPVQRALKILEFSSMPGTSRHHWGTDIDLNALENSYFEKGQGKKEYEWLINNAKAFGFCQTYTALGVERPHGYQEEKWHWSYKPIAFHITQAARNQISNDSIVGFKGAETAKDIDVVNKYILGINPSCNH